ncbi:MAG: DegT/DnrJ/EryC1/StrS family aminotransferase [bacterium]
MRIPLIDLAAQYRSLKPELEEAIHKVLNAGSFILGPNVAALEREVAAFIGAKYGVGVASGTDALVLTLRALDIGPGDEVIVPAYTFFATAEAVMLVGAKPVFVDIKEDTYQIDTQQIPEVTTQKTRAIIAVHLFGHPVDLTALRQLAQKFNLKLIEDNAQAFGAEYCERKTGSFGDVGCLSFFPSKNLGGYGDGGMIVTDDERVTEKVKMLRTHGWRQKYCPEIVGYNSRLDELQAAILRVKLQHVDAWNERRRALAMVYTKLLAELEIRLPYESPRCKHVYHMYVIQLRERDHIQAYLQKAGIGTAVYYPRPLHLTKPCQMLGYKEGQFKVAEKASNETLAIPLYPEMTNEQQQRVMHTLARAMHATTK